MPSATEMLIIRVKRLYVNIFLRSQSTTRVSNINFSIEMAAEPVARVIISGRGSKIRNTVWGY